MGRWGRCLAEPRASHWRKVSEKRVLANVSSMKSTGGGKRVGYLHDMANDRQRDRFDVLAPRDLIITLRSLERRFGSVKDRAGNPRLSEIVERPGPSGASLDAVISDAARGGSLVAIALETSLTASEPVVAAAALNPSERVFTDDRGWSIEAAVDTITSDAAAAASRVDDASADELSRAVAVTGSGATTPLAIAQQLAREFIEALTTSERHVEWLEEQV